jgi:hypothetical protein
MTQHEDLRDHCGLATNEQAKAPTSRIIITYTSRTTIIVILCPNRKIPAHSMCDDFWHGTGQTPGAQAALRKVLHAALDVWRAAVNMPEPKEPRGADLVRRRSSLR